MAAGGVLEAVDAVLGTRALPGAVALVRPPGHHAERDAPMGFCLFNNTAVAARWAQRAHDLERVAIVDWDVHHGNGTEEIFYADGSVLCVSLHQEGLYPAAHRRARGARGGAGRGRERQRAAAGRHGRRRLRVRLRARRGADRARASARSCC